MDEDKDDFFVLYIELWNLRKYASEKSYNCSFGPTNWKVYDGHRNCLVRDKEDGLQGQGCGYSAVTLLGTWKCLRRSSRQNPRCSDSEGWRVIIKCFWGKKSSDWRKKGERETGQRREERRKRRAESEVRRATVCTGQGNQGHCPRKARQGGKTRHPLDWCRDPRVQRQL